MVVDGVLRAVSLTFLIALVGCQPTALVIVVDAEQELELDEVTIVASRAGSEGQTTMRVDIAERPLPGSLTVRAGAGTEVSVEVRGMRGDVEVARERVRTSMVGGRALRLPILLRACSDGAERVVPPASLSDWSGEPIVEREAGACPLPSLDASVDGGVDASMDGGVDASLDGGVDASTDAAADAALDAPMGRDAEWPWEDPYHGAPCTDGRCPLGYECVSADADLETANVGQRYGRCRRTCWVDDMESFDCGTIAPGSYCHSTTCSLPCDPTDPRSCPGGTCGIFWRYVGRDVYPVTMCRGVSETASVDHACRETWEQYDCPAQTLCDTAWRRCLPPCRVGGSDCSKFERCDSFGTPYGGTTEYGVCVSD